MAMYFRAFFFLFHCSFFFAGSSEGLAAENHSEDISRDYKRAEELFNKGHERLALGSLSDFLRRYPNSQEAPQIEAWLGELKLRASQWSAAEYHLKRAIRHSKASKLQRLEWTLKLARSLSSQGKTQEALIELRAIKRQYPESQEAKEALTLLGELHAS